ncbi:hypothetical protein B0G75_14216 [Paraburkholderia sp. BL18I3N2]|uniref:hypothetical protein n=1 Tax=Paraburkholderia sp. BL18I3N2 TaxID=1938799 RepID=UPI000D071C00|nr:hypothetical protein [Paraburkholderia sp. BL18I3N2]PRX18510.1 hypothetical protein B0G75_14216 [Paraburkholderia sp. BL18I3N2]
MDDVEQFRDDLENSADCLMGGSRDDFIETLGEAVYARVGSDQQDRIIAAYTMERAKRCLFDSGNTYRSRMASNALRWPRDEDRPARGGGDGG